MVLRAVLTADDQEIGNVIAMRLNPLTEPEDDDRCTWTWTVTVNGLPDLTSDDRGPVHTRHGDGHWSVMAGVLAKAGYGA